MFEIIRKIRYISLFSIVPFALWQMGCKPTPTVPPTINPEAKKGLFILNEGQWTQNNASVTFYDDNNNKTADIFYAVNQTKLGDVANAWLREGDTLFITINNSKLVYKILLPSFRLLKTLTLPENSSPRMMTRVSDNKAYINSLLDNSVYIINPVTMQAFPQKITIENYAEAMIKCNNNVFISCGNYAYPAKNNKIAVIDGEQDKLIRYISTPIENPGPLAVINSGVWVGLRGGYTEKKSGLCKINSNSLEIDTTIYFNGNLYGFEAAAPYLYIVNDSGITRFNANTYEVNYNYLTKIDLGVNEFDLIYGLSYDKNDKRLYISVSSTGGSGGAVYAVNLLDKKIAKRYDAGSFPKYTFKYP